MHVGCSQLMRYINVMGRWVTHYGIMVLSQGKYPGHIVHSKIIASTVLHMLTGCKQMNIPHPSFVHPIRHALSALRRVKKWRQSQTGIWGLKSGIQFTPLFVCMITTNHL